ncbi:amino acid ABC transporter permease [Shumkonia mesophila]|uniref:amino acid ABC transporter permease n=1 Tax=Shumkonia mesophila TaxID=2838854 RepID=UPI002934CE59|nr:amino acid ABC transporter permease [Shumkonia mesophila]
MLQTFGWDGFLFLVRGAGWTLALFLSSMVVGSLLALPLSILRVLAPKPIRLLVAGYIEIVEATPLLVLIFITFFGLSFLGFHFPPLTAAGAALSLYTAAYCADIWRGCIEAIPRQQWEGGRALALTQGQQLRYVILPQAFKIALSPTVGFMVQLLKNSSLTALIGFVELTRAGQIMNNMTFQPFRVFLTVAAIYFVMCYPLSLLSQKLSGGENARRAG